MVTTPFLPQPCSEPGKKAPVLGLAAARSYVRLVPFNEGGDVALLPWPWTCLPGGPEPLLCWGLVGGTTDRSSSSVSVLLD